MPIPISRSSVLTFTSFTPLTAMANVINIKNTDNSFFILPPEIILIFKSFSKTIFCIFIKYIHIMKNIIVIKFYSI